MVKEDIICKKISVIDLVFNHTITLECELKVVSRMPCLPEQQNHFKTSSIGGNVVPNVKSMDSQREQKACEAILQAVGQRSQLIPEVLDTINEAFCQDQCLQGQRFEENSLRRACQTTRMVELSKTNNSSLIRPTCKAFPSRGRGMVFGVRLDRRAELEKSTAELDAARTRVKNIGHADEIVKVRRRG